MLKWVGRFLFIIIVLMATVPVMRYGNLQSLEAFYEDHMKGEELNFPVYMKGINTLLVLDYYESVPIDHFTYSSDSDSYQMDLYRIGSTEGKDKLNGLLFYLYDYVLYDIDNKVIEEPYIKFTLTMDNPVTYKTVTIDGTEEKVPIYTYEYEYKIHKNLAIPIFFLYDRYGELKTEIEVEGDTPGEKVKQDAYQTILRIEVNYSDRVTDGKIDYSLYDPLMILTNQSINEESTKYIRLNYEIRPEDYRLREQFEGSTPTEEEMITFGLVDDKFSLKPYNWIIWRTIIIYTLIILVITYFLFFHKKVMEKRKFRHIDQSSKSSQSINAEPIFKDPEPTPKDGK